MIRLLRCFVMTKKKVSLIVGSGFSSALTSGPRPPLGNLPVPTLSGLTGAVLKHVLGRDQGQLSEAPFPSETIQATISMLERNERLDPDCRYDYEQLISLLPIKSSLFADLLPSTKLPKAGKNLSIEENQDILRCLIYFTLSMLAECLAIDGKLTKNRNIFYSVKDTSRVRAFQDELRRLIDECDITFISFNYDGLLEAFLDCKLGEDPPLFHYHPEISHGLPIVRPENVLGTFDPARTYRIMQDRPPLVLKPHGSMHFHQLKDPIRKLTNGPFLAAVTPRFDIGFDQKTMQRDIPDVPFWNFADPIPFIIPPLINKEAFFSLDYSKTVLGWVVERLVDAEVIVSLGFSIPRSDLYISALLELVAQSTVGRRPKKLGLIYRSGPNDRTASNWRRIFGNAAIEEIETEGIDVSSVEAIKSLWVKIFRSISS